MSDWSDLPQGFEIRPVGVWPGSPTTTRTYSPFRASLRTTLKELGLELRAVSARNTVLRIDIRESNLRVDGRPRADARAEGPGIILNFEGYLAGKYTPLEYAADAFVDWRDNLRAIALTLNALRAVDRYGVSKRAEQYRGYQALPPGGTRLGASDGMTREQAAAFLAEHSDHEAVLIAAFEATAKTAYRQAAGRLHPDMANGDEHLFKRLGAAKEALSL